MGKNSTRKEIKVLGIDTRENSFHLHGVDAKGNPVFREHYSRAKMLEFMANLKPCLVGIEACPGAHHVARELKNMGHDVRMMVAQRVKPYVKNKKNNRLDSAAICEAVQQPMMRFVTIKSLEQQDIKSLHRMRNKTISHRTALNNMIYKLLMDYGVVIPTGPDQVRSLIPKILNDTGNGLTEWFRDELRQLNDQLLHFDRRIHGFDGQIKDISRENQSCRMLETIPGIDPLTSTALIAAIGDVSVFKNGRAMAAWLGLVPRQHSTEEGTCLARIGNQGDAYLKMLLLHGARSALIQAREKKDRLSRWVTKLEKRRGWNVATVALAAKNARIVWALLAKGETFKVAEAEES
ncbi:MAG: IS110 family transposase [Magnetococcales bacterium]|nr:IS110 family transposase [Magnetococcales bacterium]